MIEVMPAPVRETNERGEWINQERFREVSGHYFEWLCQTREQFRALVESLPRTKYTTLRVESGGRVSKGARAVHIRLKALKRERSRRRYPTLTLDLTGIL